MRRAGAGRPTTCADRSRRPRDARAPPPSIASRTEHDGPAAAARRGPAAAATPVPPREPRPPAARRGSPTVPTPPPAAGPAREARPASACAAGVERRCSALVGQADDALPARKYDAAIDVYDEALKLDPQNARARQGRSTAIRRAPWRRGAAGGPRGQLRVRPRRRPPAPRRARRRTRPRASRTGATCRCKRAPRPAQLPGKINFDVDPERVKAAIPTRSACTS